MDVAMNHLIHNTRTAHHGVKFSPLPCHLEHCIWEAGEKPLVLQHQPPRAAPSSWYEEGSDFPEIT